MYLISIELHYLFNIFIQMELNFNKINLFFHHVIVIGYVEHRKVEVFIGKNSNPFEWKYWMILFIMVCGLVMYLVKWNVQLNSTHRHCGNPQKKVLNFPL